MKVIGLTGGIASGKSTVAAMFRALGAQVIDADQIARAVVEPGTPALADIVAHFGDEVLLADGTLDRKRLGERVFGSSADRQRLGEITHPRIAAESAAAFSRLAAAGHDVALYEAALLVENGIHLRLAGLIVVAVPTDVQRERLMQRDHLDLAAAEARIAAQLPLEDKIAVATWVIDNSGTEAATRAAVEQIWRELQQPGDAADGDADTTDVDAATSDPTEGDADTTDGDAATSDTTDGDATCGRRGPR